MVGTGVEEEERKKLIIRNSRRYGRSNIDIFRYYSVAINIFFLSENVVSKWFAVSKRRSWGGGGVLAKWAPKKRKKNSPTSWKIVKINERKFVERKTFLWITFSHVSRNRSHSVQRGWKKKRKYFKKIENYLTSNFCRDFPRSFDLQRAFRISPFLRG